MKDLFSSLVARAWDTGPRLRPQIAPRFAPRTATAPVEEIDVEQDAPARSPADLEPARAPRGESSSEGRPPAREATGAAPAEASKSTEATASPGRVAAIVEDHAEREGSIPASISTREPALDRAPRVAPGPSVERVIESIERTLVLPAEPPVATPPPPLRPADAAALRPATPAGPRLAATAASHRSDPDAPETQALAPSPEPVVITIGRIDVRATTALPPVARPRKPSVQTPLSLHEYLRGRQDGR